MTRAAYPSDLSDREWEKLAPLIPPANLGGAPRRVNIREIVNGLFYVARTKCQWWELPHDLPNWTTIHWYLESVSATACGKR